MSAVDDRRARGAEYEIAFCKLALAHNWEVAAAHGKVIAALGLRGAKEIRDSSRADVTLRSKMGLYAAHEVKGKYPTPDGCYGLECGLSGSEHTHGEADRLGKLLDLAESADLVYYTIFDTRKKEWRTANILTLARMLASPDEEAYLRAESADKTLWGGEWHRALMAYWHERFWGSLLRAWGKLAP